MCRAGTLSLDSLHVELHLDFAASSLTFGTLHSALAGPRACGLILHHTDPNMVGCSRNGCAEFSWISLAHARRVEERALSRNDPAHSDRGRRLSGWPAVKKATFDLSQQPAAGEAVLAARQHLELIKAGDDPWSLLVGWPQARHPCLVSCRESVSHRVARAVGFHVYCLTKPCGAALDVDEHSQPSYLFASAAVLGIITAVSAVAARVVCRRWTLDPGPCCRWTRCLCGSVSALAAILGVALTIAACNRQFDTLAELRMARADGAALIAARCSQAGRQRAGRHYGQLDSLAQECVDQHCLATHDALTRRFATPAACLATRLSTAATLTNMRGVALHLSDGDHPRRSHKRRMRNASLPGASLPHGVTLRLPIGKPRSGQAVVGQAATMGLCTAAGRRRRDGPVSMVLKHSMP